MADPITMTAMAVGTGMQAYGQIKQSEAAYAQGKYNRDAAYREAEGLEIEAEQEIAAGSHNSERIAKRARQILAENRAKAASGGQSTSDGTVVAIRKETVGTSSLDQLLEMAAAEENASRLKYQATVRRNGGDLDLANARQARSASRLAAGATLLQGGASWSSRYGGGGSSGSLTKYESKAISSSNQKFGYG